MGNPIRLVGGLAGGLGAPSAGERARPCGARTTPNAGLPFEPGLAVAASPTPQREGKCSGG